jgi:predicted ATPase/HPt (histidine-containing phosphotransfer) domain-containing protein
MLLERYELGELLAESERNTVRRVRRTSDGAALVVKTSTREYPTVRECRRLEFEYHLLCKVRSPGVITPVELEREGGRVAIVLEDFGGERVSPSAGVGLPLGEFFPLAIAVARALGEVHARGVIHKDINPRNILRNPRTGEVKVIDFSLGSELGRERQRALHHTGLEGTLPYLSPEQTGRMNRDLDYRTDYYSLGVTFFELLTGSPPFSAPDALGYLHCHLSRPAPSARDSAPEVPEALSRLVMKLMSKSPDERYQSARGLLADLTRCRDEWQAQGSVAEFALGREDIPERFMVSQEVLGRSAEAEVLLSVFERAAQGPAQLLMVAGYSGIGKSTLVSEIHRPVVEKRAQFISGKSEPLERNLPYGALIVALRGLLRQRLAEPERQLAEDRETLSRQLGNDASVLVPLLPELGQILGPVPAVAELSAREAQSRLARCFRDLLRAIATPAQPLVVFLDDLQWTDGATPHLLAYLLGDGELRHVFFIGAMRDNEVGPDHLLRLGLDALQKKRPDVLHELSLAPLPAAIVGRIVASTLHCDESRCSDLSALVFEKTAGNPFFLHELLGVLYREGAIEFSAEQGCWIWHADAVARAAVSDNVVDLMLRRLERLPAEAREYMRIAACFGNQFDLARLAPLTGASPRVVAAALWPALEQGLLLSRGEAYRLFERGPGDEGGEIEDATVIYQFPHDRVTEAAYSLLAPCERAELHLRIGRFAMGRLGKEERATKVFEFIDHLNSGRALLTSEQERVELSELNHRAAQRARRSAAYGAAIAYLGTALDLLSPGEWASRQSQRFECARMHVECTFLSGQVEQAKQAAEELLAQAPDPISRVAAVCLKAAILEQRSHLVEAVATIRQGLAELGVTLPEEPAAIEREIGAGIGKLTGHLERIAIEELVSLPSATDPLRVAAMELLFQIIPAASQINPPLFILAELILFDLAVTHGTIAASAKNFMDCGIVLGAMLGDYPRAYRMGKVAFTLLERHAPTPLESAVNFVFGCFISHWGAHHREGLDALARGYQRGVELGDVLHASYSIVHRAKSAFFAGKELGDCQAETERAMTYTQATGAVGHAAMPRIQARALATLRGNDSADAALPDAEFLREIEKTENGHYLLVLGQTETLVHLVLGDQPRAQYWDEVATRHIGVGNGAFPVPDYYLCQALLLGRKWRTAPAEERQAILATLEKHAATLASFASASPQNFAHKHLLVRAEIERLRGGSIDEVLRLHREATQAAGDDYVHVRALAQELLADFWKEKGHPGFARECLLEAYHLYRHWGAVAKLSQLEREHGKWLGAATRGSALNSVTGTTLATATATSHMDTVSLDVASAIKSTLAISSEVKPERLFLVLMQTIIENAGAEHGYLVTVDERDALIVSARASISDSGPSSMARLALPLEACDLLSRDMVRFVARTRETLILDDARKDDTYRQDAHVLERGVRSALCMPISSQGRLLAILYLENNALARAFTPARLAFLRVIAGQAAVAIANARLYDELELRVAERTRQLADQSREISAMLNSLEQGVFTVDEALCVRPRYSSHLEQLLATRDIAGRDCIDLLFSSSDVEAQSLANMRAALEFSFGAPIAFAEANKSHWVRKFKRSLAGEQRSFELDWTLIADADDVVSHVLVALRDVTLLEQVSAQAAKHARELDFVGQILDAGVEAFRRFMVAARALIVQCQESFASGERGHAAREQWKERTFRTLHTLKGNARLLGLVQLAQTVHVAEEHFDARSALGGASTRAQMLAAVETVLARLEEYDEVYARKIGDAIVTASRDDERWRQAVESCVEGARSGALAPADALAAIEELFARGVSVPLEEVLAPSRRLLPVLALELGKGAPEVELQGGQLLVSAAWAARLGDAFIHLFQNALAHGIEAPEERSRCNKPVSGRISLRVASSPRGTWLRLSDDGAGLDLERLRARSGDAAASDEDVAQTIFSRGVTTTDTVTAVAGRGVGLDVVRAAMRELGGDVSLVFTGPVVGGRRPFELVLELPQGASSNDAQSRVRASSAPGRAGVASKPLASDA